MAGKRHVVIGSFTNGMLSCYILQLFDIACIRSTTMSLKILFLVEHLNVLFSSKSNTSREFFFQNQPHMFVQLALK